VISHEGFQRAEQPETHEPPYIVWRQPWQFDGNRTTAVVKECFIWSPAGDPHGTDAR
jgi:hypothetical protein